MSTEIKLPFFIAIIACLEAGIYFWAAWTATLKEGNYFAIPHHLIFKKCARNSGRVSAALHLVILLMIGYFGLKQIYSEKTKLDMFLALITIFTINHLIHFFFISRNFKKNSKTINVSEEKHGIMTFVCITLFPIILWPLKNLNTALYIVIILHVFNVSFVFLDVLYNKIRCKSKVSIHNRFGILVTTLACLYVVYRVFLEF